MIGIAFSGGGIRGSYQVGAYYAFKKCHIKVDGFVGTSIGSFNAAMLASGKERELLHFWQNIDACRVFGFTENLGTLVNENKKGILVYEEIIKNVNNILKSRGISIDGLKAELTKLDIAKSLYKSKKDFGLVTVRYKHFKPCYMFKEDIPPKLLDEYLIASCYLPVFKREKLIDDNYYLDGGFWDYAPANSLLERGYDKVYVIDLEAIGIRRKYKNKNKVEVIRPSRSLGGILNINTNNINKNIKLGYYDTLKVLKHLDGYKYIFKVRNDLYYQKLIKHIDNKDLWNIKRELGTIDNKKAIIKAVEYVMKKEKFTYYKIYDIRKVIRKIRKIKSNDIVYKFISELGR